MTDLWDVNCSASSSHRACAIRCCAKTKGVTVLATTRCHRTMRLISLCVAIFAAEIQSEQDLSECLSIYA